ncbi:conjugal transfer protein TraB [Streptomyces sp. NBC_00474]|uniref:conjugal transfer protein TraB n=1 Tax=Streptomyces sp. NBC_00474 TaxID=2975754 RepID=UPI00225B28B0|nr:conjugal transfer protein TraB [Streptomyces sp. NBC_00474]MCX5055087.1 conjugal transfer protein TraB [Streptomyces sp. NBC_00474]
MSSELAPTQSNQPAPTDSDNHYKAVQAKLVKLARSMDDATLELEGLRRSMQANATRCEGVARDIANAELDKLFVDLTNNVSVALGGAAIQVAKLQVTAEETADLSRDTRWQHSELYGALDDIRSGRRVRTPRPGFFTH